jgi:hypothetical protein
MNLKAIIAGVFLIGLVTGLLLRGLYDIVPGGNGMVFRVNHFTGSVVFCHGSTCEQPQ